MNIIEKIVYQLIAIGLAFGLFTSFINKEYYESTLAKEDGFLEYTTVYALLMCAQVCVLRLIKLRKKKSILFLLGTLLGAIIFLFGAGEEISWGQRIFNVQPSEFFVQNNSQGETNLHNLVVEGKRINKIIFGTGLGIVVAFYLLILPWLYDKKSSIKNFINQLGIPLPKKQHILAYVILFVLVSIVPSPKRGELLEFGGCLLFMLMLLYPKNQENFY